MIKLIIIAASLLHPMPQYDYSYYQWCMQNIGMGDQYCCQQAGGVLNGGNCWDPNLPPFVH